MISKSIKFLLSLTILALLIVWTEPQELFAALSELSFSGMLLLIMLSFVMIAVSAFKWQIFVQSAGIKVQFCKLYKYYLLGYFINMFVPSYVGGDALRSYYIGKSVGQHQAFSATILERATGFIAMFVLALAAVCYRIDLFDHATAKFVSIFSVIVLTSLILFFALGRGPVLKLFKSISNLSFLNKSKFVKKFIAHLTKLFEVLFSQNISIKNWLLIIFLSLLFHMLTVVNTYYAGGLIGWDNIPIQDLFVVLPIILMISVIPITPSGIGLQEGAFYHYLQQLGATPGQALAVALVLRAKALILALLGWLVWLKLDLNKISNSPKKSI